MKRTAVIAACLCVLCCGCTKADGNGGEDLTQRISFMNDYTAPSPNTYRRYYSCWINPGIGIMDETTTGIVLNDGGTQFVMSIHPNGRMIGYSAETENQAETMSAEGQYRLPDGQTAEYDLSVFQLEDIDYAVVETDAVTIIAAGTLLQVLHICPDMLKLAASVRLDQEKLSSDFRENSADEYAGRQMKLFKTIMPESGLISDLMTDDGE